MTEHGANQSRAEARRPTLEFPCGGGSSSAGSERERGRCVEEGSHAWEDPNPSCKTKVGISPATERDSDMHGEKINGSLWGWGLYLFLSRRWPPWS